MQNQNTVPHLFRHFISYLSMLVLSCMDGCAPASNPCGSMVASAEDHWGIPNYGSYGGKIVWNVMNSHKEKHCTAAFQASTAESSLRSVSAFHCMRDLVLDYMMMHHQNPSHREKGAEENFSIYIALNVSHVEGSICRNAESAEKLVYVRTPVDFTDIPFLVDLEKKYQAIYVGLPADQQASGEWVKVIKSREMKWIESFYDEKMADDFKITSGGDGEEDNENIEEKYEHLACATQHFDDYLYGEYNDYFASTLETEHSKLHVMCFLHSDVAIVDIGMSSNLQFKPEDKACLYHARLNFETGTPLWGLHKDSEPWLQAQLNLREASLSSAMSKDDASLRYIDALSKSELYDYYREKPSPFVNDKDMVYGYGPGLTLFTEFKTKRDEPFSFSELFLGATSRNQKSTSRKQHILGQDVPVVFSKNWGMIALYSSAMEVLTGASGSLVAYKNNFLSVLHSIDGKEYMSATRPAKGSIVIIDKYVDIPEDDPSELSDSMQIPDHITTDNTKTPSPIPSPPPSSSTSNGPPNKPPQKVLVPNSKSSPGPASASPADKRGVADPDSTPAQRQQPPQEPERVANNAQEAPSSDTPEPEMSPSGPGSHDQPQQDTSTDPCVPY